MADELDDIAIGRKLVTEKPTVFGEAMLTGTGIPVATPSGVQMRDGSSGQPIQLPELDEHAISEAFKYMVIVTAGKVMKALLASPDPTKLYLVSRNGKFKFEELAPEKCFVAEDICDCPPDFVAGWQENEDGKLCLVKFTASGDGDVWADTTTVAISGAGVDGDPFAATVKISEDAGNILESRADGLFVPA